MTEYTVPTTGHPYDVVAGPDGNMWFTEIGPDNTQYIGWFTPPPASGPGDVKCTKAASNNLAKLTGCMGKCRVKVVGALSSGKLFDELACSANCRAKYDAQAAKLLAKGGCPACLDAQQQAGLADQLTTSLVGTNGSSIAVLLYPPRASSIHS